MDFDHIKVLLLSSPTEFDNSVIEHAFKRLIYLLISTDNETNAIAMFNLLSLFSHIHTAHLTSLKCCDDIIGVVSTYICRDCVHLANAFIILDVVADMLTQYLIEDILLNEGELTFGNLFLVLLSISHNPLSHIHIKLCFNFSVILLR